jgi:2-polyprenyl-3-methyl-5-hydroxy-6-metoxy-1,4-benzoquinol methylase
VDGVNFPFYEAAPKEIVAQCNLCGRQAFHMRDLEDRYGLHAPTVQCAGCGLTFLSFRMTEKAYREFYRDGHYRRLLSEFYGRPITAQSIEDEQRDYAMRLSAWLMPHMDAHRSGLLMDVGGSTGVVAERLVFDYDMDGTVIEPAAEESARARDRGLSVAPVPIEEYDNPVQYDLILLCQTVDHLLDIKGALRRIRQWIKPTGLFFVDFVENGPVKIDHPYYLTRKTMQEYLARTGFMVKILEPSSDSIHINVLAVPL